MSEKAPQQRKVLAATSSPIEGYERLEVRENKNGDPYYMGIDADSNPGRLKEVAVLEAYGYDPLARPEPPLSKSQIKAQLKAQRKATVAAMPESERMARTGTFTQYEEAAEAIVAEKRRKAAIIDAAHEDALSGMQKSAEIEEKLKSPEVAALNDKAQLEIWGSGNHTYTDPVSGEVIASPEKPYVGLLERIRESDKTKPATEASAFIDRYEDGLQNLMEQEGLELCQAKMIMDMRVSDEREGIPRFTTQLMKHNGLSADQAEKKAWTVYYDKDLKRQELIKENGIVTADEYERFRNGDSAGDDTEQDDSSDAEKSAEEEKDERIKNILDLQKQIVDAKKLLQDSSLAIDLDRLANGQQPEFNRGKSKAEAKKDAKQGRIRRAAKWLGGILSAKSWQRAEADEASTPAMSEEDVISAGVNNEQKNTPVATTEGNSPEDSGDDESNDEPEKTSDDTKEDDDGEENSGRSKDKASKRAKKEAEEAQAAFARIYGESDTNDEGGTEGDESTGGNMRVLSPKESLEIKRNKALQGLRKGRKIELGDYGAGKILEVIKQDDGQRRFRIEQENGRELVLAERLVGELMIPGSTRASGAESQGQAAPVSRRKPEAEDSSDGSKEDGSSAPAEEDASSQSSTSNVRVIPNPNP